MDSKDFSDFHGVYNDLISTAGREQIDNFACLASPTLSKQETITFLYEDILTYLDSAKILNRDKKVVTSGNRFIFFIRIIYYLFNLLFFSRLFRVNSVPDNCYYIRSWLVPRSIKQGAVYDDYFCGLIDDLQTNYPVIVGLQPLNFGRLLWDFRRVNKSNNFIVPIGLLSSKDIFKLMLDYLRSAKVILKEKYYFKGRDITSLINRSLTHDYLKFRSFQAYLDLYIARKLIKYRPKKFLYVFENQAWEKAYLYAFKNTDIETIGYQSSGFSYRFLNFFSNKIDAEYSMFPNRILTVGELYTDVLNNMTFIPSRIETFAALRFNYLNVDGRYSIETFVTDIHQRLLYAFPVHKYQYLVILKDLIDVFENSCIEVHLKFHPLHNMSAGCLKLPENFKIYSSHEGRDFNSLYDVVLFNDNSFGIESLILGVKSYEYNFGELYPENRLIDFQCYNPSLDKDSLQILKMQLTTGVYDKAFDKEYVDRYINRCYKPYKDKMMNLI